MRYYLLSVFVSVSLLFSACSYLDQVPEEDIETIESIFELREHADSWLRGCYGMAAPFATSFAGNPAYFGADEFVMCEVLRNYESGGIAMYPGQKIAEGLQMSQNPYGNIWDEGPGTILSLYEDIRNCNTFLDNIDNVYNMEDTEKRQWKAEIQALKAYCYFELVRRYGPIVLVPENISVDADQEDIYQPRVHVDSCFKAIVNLLDDAAEYLLAGDTRPHERAAYFSKEAALALKARVLLYAASPLFNGNADYSDFTGKNGEPLFSTEYDPEKWRLAAEAADEAVEFAEAHGHELYSGTTGQGSDLLNTMYDIEYSVHSVFDNPEFILEWKYTPLHAHFLPNLPEIEDHYNSRFTGAINPSLKIIEMYYTKNGLPIEYDSEWADGNWYGEMVAESDPRYENVVPLDGTEVLKFHLQREPRFYANIAADRTYWKRGPIGGTVNNNLLVEAYKGEDFGTSLDIISTNDYQNVNGYWLKKHTYSDLQTRSYTIGYDETFPVIRLAELYLIQAEAWNEYEGPSDKVYVPLNKVRERAGIPDVQTSWKNFSTDPGKVDTKEGMREIIRHEINVEFAFEGHRFFNLRRWKTAHEELNDHPMGWNILGETADEFYNHMKGPQPVETERKFTAPRDYLFPIRAEEILISSVVQNPGW